jgi:hypothetical protein
MNISAADDIISTFPVTPNAAPQAGETCLVFKGDGDHVEISSAPALSPATTGALAISAWMRPDALNFPAWEGSGYVYWLGKGQTAGDSGDQEYALRIYNRDNTREKPPRPNRLSGYLFNSSGGLGVGSYFQDELAAGVWIHVVFCVDGRSTSIYRDGAFRRCDQYQPGGDSRCARHFDPGTHVPLFIQPRSGPAPLRLGTKDARSSFFAGAISRVRLWNRALSASQVANLYLADELSRDGLVAEYLLDEGHGSAAGDTAGAHPGTIHGADWGTA